MMGSGKDTAMIILGKKGKNNSESQDDMMGDEMNYEEEEMEDYSEEQYQMADELIDAVKSGSSEAVLDAIHGIYNSY